MAYPSPTRGQHKWGEASIPAQQGGPLGVSDRMQGPALLRMEGECVSCMTSSSGRKAPHSPNSNSNPTYLPVITKYVTYQFCISLHTHCSIPVYLLATHLLFTLSLINTLWVLHTLCVNVINIPCIILSSPHTYSLTYLPM